MAPIEVSTPMNEGLQRQPSQRIAGASMAVDLPGYLPVETTETLITVDVAGFTAMQNGDCCGTIKGLWKLFTGGLYGPTMKWASGAKVKSEASMRNARELEAASGLSKAAFFNKYGFVLLDHHSAMSAEDWEKSNETSRAAFTDTKHISPLYGIDTPASKVYGKECEGLARKLFPNISRVSAPSLGVLRGPNGYQVYGAAVHSDFPIKFDDWDKCASQRIHYFQTEEEYQRIKTGNFHLINFWRPVLPMKGLCQDKPLCVLDHHTVAKEDVVTISLLGRNYGGELYLSLKRNPKHQWYYYPDMTTDEVLVFKQMHHVAGEVDMRMPTFHTAFHDPTAPKDVETRSSFDYRFSFHT